MSNPNPVHRFQPGVSGNPGGRPKREWTWAGLLEDAVNEMLESKDGTKIEAKKAIAKRIARMAVEGDIMAQREIMNRMEGMPKQGVEHSGSIDLPQPIYGGKSTDKPNI